VKPIRATADRILVTLGGADVPNATLIVMQALRQITFRRLNIRLVIGAANKHIHSLQAALPNLLEQHEVELLVNPPNIPALMDWSDVTITAAGSSCWELCCLGVPQLILVTADNQRLMPAYFIKHDIAEVFGELNDTRLHELAQRLGSLLKDESRRVQLSQAAKRVIDGGGAARVVNFILGQS
jgi:spore coat polysaccharide biosynthesis predicted glycosyltransferase SpsG